MTWLCKLVSPVLIACLLAACGGVPRAPEDARSAHFDPVTERLDIGGEVFVYVDISEDIEQLTEALVQVVDEAREGAAAEELPDVDLRALIGELGLNPIDAVGLSSYARGELYHNRSFVLIDGPREGLLTAFGGDPHPFHVLQMAPKDADLVFESDINFQVIYEMVLRMVDQIAPEAAAAVRGALDEPMAPLSLTPGQLLAEMDTRLFGVVRMYDGKKISWPDPPLEMPFVDFVIGFDRLAFVAREVGQLENEVPLLKYSEQQNWQIVEPTIPLGGPVAGYAPVLVGDTETGRLLLASSMEYLKQCLTINGGSLGETPEFDEAFYRLPRTGNSMSYVSGRFARQLSELAVSLAAEESEDMQGVSRLLENLMPETNQAQAAVTQNLERGIFGASNAAGSHKATLATAAFANPMVLGVLAAIAIPAFTETLTGPEAEDAPAALKMSSTVQGAEAPQGTLAQSAQKK